VIVKLLLICSVLAILAWVIRSRPSTRRLALTRIASIAVAVCWVVAVINPDLVTWVANLIGVGRGTDLVLYLLVVVFTISGVAQYQRIRRLEDRIAELTRSQALLGRRVEDDSSRRDQAEDSRTP
jgi:hypothetical protein